MTPFYIADDQIIVPEGTHPAALGRINRSRKFAPTMKCGVHLDAMPVPIFANTIQWLREKNFPSVLIEDYDVVFFANEADLMLFLLTWTGK